MEKILDSLTKCGAENLARKLDNYWFRKGHFNVKHAVQESDLKDTWIVRSNLVNGMPPK